MSHDPEASFELIDVVLILSVCCFGQRTPKREVDELSHLQIFRPLPPLAMDESDFRRQIAKFEQRSLTTLFREM